MGVHTGCSCSSEGGGAGGDRCCFRVVGSLSASEICEERGELEAEELMSWRGVQ